MQHDNVLRKLNLNLFDFSGEGGGGGGFCRQTFANMLHLFNLICNLTDGSVGNLFATMLLHS